MRKDLIEHTCPTIAIESDVLFDKNIDLQMPLT